MIDDGFRPGISRCPPAARARQSLLSNSSRVLLPRADEGREGGDASPGKDKEGNN